MSKKDINDIMDLLFPTPQEVEIFEENLCFDLKKVNIRICLSSNELFSHGMALKEELLNQKIHSQIFIESEENSRINDHQILVSISKKDFDRQESYKLMINKEKIVILSADHVGLFYGILTFCQIIKLYYSKNYSDLPCLEINDYPDFPNRGVMLDISRNKVPTMDTLYKLIDLLASWKINQFQLYMEHTFAYQGHEKVWKDASPLTGEEILALEDFCRKRYIELVPNQNSFGHLHRWLKYDQYRHLAECPEGFNNPFTLSNEPFSLNPTDNQSLEFLDDLYNQLLPYFSSNQINVGLDETFDLGKGKSKALCDIKGRGNVYLEFLLKIYSLVKKKGFNMQFWADIIFEYPELIELIPKDATPLIWGYEENHPFDFQGQKLKELGFHYYVCPGTSSWNSILGRTNNAIANLCNAAINGKLYGAVGFLNTDWGDHGHHQPLSVSYLGYLVGAGVSWNTKFAETIEDRNIPELLDRYVFHDSAGIMGKIAFDLGNSLYEVGFNYPNSSALHSNLIFSQKESTIDLLRMTSIENLRRTYDFIESSINQINRVEMNKEEADLIKREFSWGAEILKFSCELGIARLEVGLEKSIDQINIKTRNQLKKELKYLIEEFKEIWLQRNRPGGLYDSVNHLERLMALL